MLGRPGAPEAPATRVILFPTEVDVANAPLLGTEIASALDAGALVVVADLSATTFCDSAGVSVLAKARLWAVAAGAELRLVVPSIAVRRVLSVMGLDQLLTVHACLADALAAGPQRG